MMGLLQVADVSCPVTLRNENSLLRCSFFRVGSRVLRINKCIDQTYLAIAQELHDLWPECLAPAEKVVSPHWGVSSKS
jgi:hypothetical protein